MTDRESIGLGLRLLGLYTGRTLTEWPATVTLEARAHWIRTAVAMDRASRADPPDMGEVTRRAVEERDDARAERDEARDALARLRESVGKHLEENGCDCDCGCDSDGHGDNCDRCLACLVDGELQATPAKLREAPRG